MPANKFLPNRKKHKTTRGTKRHTCPICHRLHSPSEHTHHGKGSFNKFKSHRATTAKNKKKAIAKRKRKRKSK